MDWISEISFNATYEYHAYKSTGKSQAHSAVTFVLYKIVNHMSFYYEMVCFPFGLVCNFLLLLVFGISSVGTTKTTRIYYLAMAYGEFGTVLFKDAWYFWADLGVPFVTGGLNILGPANAMGGIGKGSPSWMCGLQVFLWYSHEMFANYIFILFQLERVIAIYAPLHARHLFTKHGTIIIVRMY